MNVGRPLPVGDDNPFTTLRVRMPDDLENEIRYANHIMVTFSGMDFVLTLLQVRPPHIADDEDRKKFASKREIVPQVLDQFAVPVAQFVTAIDSINDLIERLRDNGNLPKPDEDVEAESAASPVDTDQDDDGDASQ